MKIEYLELYNYKRLFLTNIYKVKYKPSKNIQIIIGSNGVGKSQLLKELSPLPADINKNYNNNGYKIIKISHNNNKYVLTSKEKHSFIKNDIELNIGGSRRNQLTLVEEHFNITPELMDILLGNIKFTEMSLADRKKWIFKCSNIDYTYPLHVFKELVTYNRDIVGYIKKIQEELSKLEIDNKTYNYNVDLIDKDINNLKELYSYYNSWLYTIENIESSEYNPIDNIKNINNKLKIMLNNIDNCAIFKNLDDQILILKTKRNVLKNEIENVKTSIDEITELSNKDIKLIEKEIKEKTIEYNSRYKSIYINNLNIDNIEKNITNYNLFKENILPIILRLEDIKFKDLAIKEKNTIEEDYKCINNEHDKLIIKRNTLLAEIDDIKKHMDLETKVKCPVCNNSFFPNLGSLKEILKKCECDLLEINKNIEKYKKILDKKHTIYLNSIEINNILNSIKELASVYYDASPIISYVLSKINILTDSTSYIINFLDKISIDGNEWIEISNIKKRIDILKNDLESVNKIEKKYRNDTKSFREKILKYKISNLKVIDLKLTKLIDYKKLKDNIEILIKDMKIKNKEYNLYVNNEIKKEYKIFINNVKDLIKEENGKNIEIYNKIKYINKDIEKIKNEIKNKTEYLNVSSTLIKILSPTEGLIAKSINSFINIFINNLNAIIDNIWSYTVTILPIQLTDDMELDYKFKVLIDSNETIDDISKLSSSLKEIVNLSFKITLSKCLKLDFPLYLDEFGATFDKTHRIEAYNVINKLMSEDFNQIFLISHYESLYSNFNNADFNILDNNVNLEKVKNTDKVLNLIRHG